MRLNRLLIGPVGVAVGFALLAAVTIHFARFTNGVAMIWVAGALLAARLSDLPEHRWTPWLVASAVASTLVTGLFGLGWAAAVPLALVNVAEAAAVALVWRRITRAFWPHETLEWLAGFYVGIGLTIPLLSGIMATLIAVMLAGLAPLDSFIHWIIGHAFGMIVCLPIFHFLYWRLARGHSMLPRVERWPLALALQGGLAVTVVSVFLLDLRPLLVFPLVYMAVAAALVEQTMIVLMPVILIVIGGTATALGIGPIALMDVSYGDRIQFFQAYVGVSVLAMLPITIERTRRMQELKALRARLAQLEQQRAPTD